MKKARDDTCSGRRVMTQCSCTCLAPLVSSARKSVAGKITHQAIASDFGDCIRFATPTAGEQSAVCGSNIDGVAYQVALQKIECAQAQSGDAADLHMGAGLLAVWT